MIGYKEEVRMQMKCNKTSVSPFKMMNVLDITLKVLPTYIVNYILLHDSTSYGIIGLKKTKLALLYRKQLEIRRN